MTQLARQRWSATRYAETAHFVPTLGAPFSKYWRRSAASESSTSVAATACSPKKSLPLNVGVQVMNALLLPVVLGFLIALARRALPKGRRLAGAHYAGVMVVALVICLLGMFGGFSGAGL